MASIPDEVAHEPLVAFVDLKLPERTNRRPSEDPKCVGDAHRSIGAQTDLDLERVQLKVEVRLKRDQSIVEVHADPEPLQTRARAKRARHRL